MYEYMNIRDLYGYINEINGGYIKANYHPVNKNIVILNYTPKTTYERRWNKYTMSARGLIIDLTSVMNNGKTKILAKTFEKFFNYGENKEYEDNIDFDNIVSVSDKLDGSLGISYILGDKLYFATRGSFESEQARKATEMWYQQYYNSWVKYQKHFKNNPTLLVEIIYPENRIVVDYDNETKLVLLGVTDGYRDYTYEEVSKIGEIIGLEVAKNYNLSLEEMINLKEEISAHKNEGWVIRFNDNKRLKIKGSEYIEAHRVIHGLSDKSKVKSWADGSIESLILSIPEEFRPEVESLNDCLNNLSLSIFSTMDYLYEYGVYKFNSNKKEFANYVNSVVQKEFRHILFNAHKKKEVSMDLVKNYIFKNYNYYLEVIEWKKKN